MSNELNRSTAGTSPFGIASTTTGTTTAAPTAAPTAATGSVPRPAALKLEPISASSASAADAAGVPLFACCADVKLGVQERHHV